MSLRTILGVTTITATCARNKLYSLINEANEWHISIQITGKRGNAILISENDWRSISDTIHLSTIPGMVDSIKKGMREKPNHSYFIALSGLIWLFIAMKFSDLLERGPGIRCRQDGGGRRWY